MSLSKKPKKPTNRPGLSQIAYRIGDYNSFRERLLSHVANYLPKLKTRDPQDFAIAILDAWAVVADVLSFYQERIANEGYLLTATERRSVLELARTIGYELKPGVAASTYLAFIVEDTPDGARNVTVPKEAQVMSVPNEGELPQIFESSQEIVARVDWNRLTPRQGRPHQITNNTQQLYLEGIATQLQPGDSILLVDREELEVARYLLSLTDVVAIPEAGHTIVTWKQPLKLNAPLRQPQVFAFRQQAALFGKVAPDWLEDVPDEIKRTANATLKGGVFQTKDQGDRWFPLNRGLPNVDILGLVVNQSNDFFVGTPGLGIFRSLDLGETWTQMIAGLTNFTVQTLYVDWERDHILAGTPRGGVFRSTDNGENWSSIGDGTIRVETSSQSGDNSVETVNTGLPDTVVRSLVTCSKPIEQNIGTLSPNNSSTKLKVDNSIVITEKLRVGDIITAADGQIRTVTEIDIDRDSLTIDYSFRPSLTGETAFSIGGTYIFAGTEEGVYRTQDQGKNWYLKGLSNRVIRALLVTYRATNQGTGTIGGTAVTGVSTTFTTELNPDDIIIAADQIRTVRGVASETTLIIEQAFESNLASSSAFFIPQRGTGTITSTGNNVTGAGTDFNSELQSGDIIIAAEQIRTIEEINSDNTLNLNQAFESNLEDPTSFFTPRRGGTITSNDTTVTVSDKTFEGDLQLGDIIIAAEQIRTIEEINSNNTLNLNQAFESNLEDPNPFFILQRRTGTIGGTAITGIGTNFTTELNSDDIIIIAAEQIKTVKGIASDTTLIIEQAFEPNLSSDTAFFIPISHQSTGTISSDRTHIFAGTDDGIFRSSNYGETWDEVNDGLSNKNVTSLATDFRVGTGTITSMNTNLTGNGTTFIDELKPGDTIVAAGQTRLIRTISAQTELTVDTAFAPDLPVGTTFALANCTNLFAGTADGGIFRSRNNGSNWEQVALKSGTGTITSEGKEVIGKNGTVFKTEIEEGYTIIADGQIRVVIKILSNENMILNQAFERDLGTETNFTISAGLTNLKITSLVADASLATGTITTITSNDKRVQGEGTIFAQELRVGDSITALGQTRIVTGIDAEHPNTVLFINEAFNPGPLPAGTNFTINNLFAGTVDGGVFRSVNHGDNWSEINGDVAAISPTRGLATREITDFARRKADLFEIAKPGILLAGTRFSGFVEQEWPGFQLASQKIDLDTLYTGILEDSWLVLVDSDRFEALQVDNVSDGSRRDFLLDTTITSIIPAEPVITPSNFSLRNTNVLLQSEQLAMAQESLDVTSQQTNIFLDPISDNSIYLSEFVQGLENGQNLIISGKHPRAKVKLGGMARSQNWNGTDAELGERIIQALSIIPGGYLLVGTDKGVNIFSSDDQGITWKSISEGLSNQNVTSFVTSSEEGIGEIVGNGTNIQGRSTSFIDQLRVGYSITVTVKDDETEIVKDIQTRAVKNIQSDEELEIDNSFSISINGKSFTINKLFAGTDRGVFRFRADTLEWEQVNQQELKNIQTLAIKQDNNSVLLFAGTKENGVWRSSDDGRNWTEINHCLTEQNIRSLLVNPDNGQIFAGTASNGIFRSTDNGDNWQQIAYTKPGTGTIASNGKEVIGNRTAFGRELKPGDLIIAAGQTRVVTELDASTPDIKLTINTPFNQDLPPRTTFDISTGLTDMSISELGIYRQPDTVTISSNGITVTGTGTNFLESLRSGDIILANNEIRTVNQIISDSQLTVDHPFDDENGLPAKTAFLTPPRSKGTISSDRTIIRGKNTVFTQELKVGDKIIVEAQEEAQERTITSISSDVICTINTSFAFNSNINLFDPNIEIKIEREGKSEQDTVSGTIFDGVVIGKGTNFTSELRAGDAIIAAGQIKIVEAVFSATEIAVNKFFETDLPEETPYFVNSQGEGSIFHIVYTATFSENPGLQTEDVIIAAGQLKTIRSVDSPTEVTLYTAFDEDLSAETPFFIPTPGQGSITSSRDRTVTFSEDPGLQPEDIIIAAGQLKIITSVNTANQEVTLDIDKAFDEDLSEETPFFVPERGQGSISRTEYTAIISDEPTFLFAATAHGGVFRSLNKGGHWEAINTGLTDLETRSLVVHPHNGYLFGGTANGRLYRSTNLGNIWNPIDAGLSSQSVGAIAIASNDKELTEAEFLFGIDILFTGAGNKVFRSSDYGRNWQNIHWQRINQGLSSLTVQAIAIHREQEKLYLFAGTREGAFSSTDGGQQWQPINDGLTNLNVQALLGFSSSFQLYAGTKEGLFRSLNYGEHWLSVDIGIAQAEIKALAFDPTTKMVFAATFADGVIRYSPESDRWIPLGLTDAYLQAMVINPANGYIFVGTTSSGIFYSTNQGNSWQQLIKTRSGTGTMTSDGINVTGAGTKFAQELRVGSKITVAGQDRTVVSIAPDNADTSITIDQPFRPDLRSSNSFTIHTGLNNLNVTALAVYPLPGTGTITSDGIKVTGKNTKFNTELTIGDTITVAGQTQTVTGIISDTELTVEEDFTNLPQGTPCTINQKRETVISNNGTLSSKGTRVIFQGTTFRESAIIPGDEIEAVGQDPNPIIKEIISDRELIIDRAFTKLPEGTPFTRDILFAGTAGSGILRSTNQGKRWSEVNAGLNNHLEIRCLSLDKYGKRILAGTALGGVFGSTNLGGLWEPLNTGLTNTDIRAIAIDSTNLFVGGIGILLSQDGFYSVEVQPSDWLSVLTVPKALSMGQQWQVKNLDNFQGTITTLTTDDITLYPAADEAETISELGIINIPPQDQQQPILELDQPLSHSYDPATVTIYGNIVEATHGETVSEEVLGSGDGAIANQRFELQKPPLTYISATTVSGIESTLTVYVNDVAWERANSLYALDQLAQGYIVRQENDGTTQVIFGDGERGARLPSGQENVVANYRSGIGVEGNIGAESLTILKTRPLGLEEVTNPLPATGGAEREDLAEARNNAPLTIRTLDRIVSLQDFEDFARSFAGIIKAQAVPLWTENNQLVHITVAAAEGDPVPVDSALYRNLVDAIDAARDPVQRVEVDSYQAIVFNLEAKVAIDPRYPIDQVENTIHLTLQQIFSFDRRGFGQAVTASEIIATIQKIEGVIAVDLDSLYARGSSKILNQSLIAQQASWDAQTNQISPAQLLFLDSDSITLSTGSSI